MKPLRGMSLSWRFLNIKMKVVVAARRQKVLVLKLALDLVKRKRRVVIQIAIVVSTATAQLIAQKTGGDLRIMYDLRDKSPKTVSYSQTKI
jgi:hypothetical protein